MARYRRYYVENAVYFITTVIRNRKPIFSDPVHINLFYEVARGVKERYPFKNLAYVILPDHLHLLLHIIEPPFKEHISKVMNSLKWNFTFEYKHFHGITTSFSSWQPGFYDHVIRNLQDLKAHLDYIHYNPVKHNYVIGPEEWSASSFRYWKHLGEYEDGWGRVEPENIRSMELE